MDVILQFGTGVEVFDVVVMEVAKAFLRSQSQLKASIDLTKVTQVIGMILHDLLARRSLSEDQRHCVQVVCFIYAGWSCCALCMWVDGDKYVMKEQAFGLALGR